MTSAGHQIYVSRMPTNPHPYANARDCSERAARAASATHWMSVRIPGVNPLHLDTGLLARVPRVAQTVLAGLNVRTALHGVSASGTESTLSQPTGYSARAGLPPWGDGSRDAGRGWRSKCAAEIGRQEVRRLSAPKRWGVPRVGEALRDGCGSGETALVSERGEFSRGSGSPRRGRTRLGALQAGNPCRQRCVATLATPPCWNRRNGPRPSVAVAGRQDGDAALPARCRGCPSRTAKRSGTCA